MGFNVHIHVCFRCDENDRVAALACRHRGLLLEEECSVVRSFLASLGERSGKNPGPKGGLSVWGIVGNYTSGERFCDTLRPFWRDLLGDVEGGPSASNRVIVFEEPEQSQAATAYQIGWNDPYSPSREIEIRKFEGLPFSWHA